MARFLLLAIPTARFALFVVVFLVLTTLLLWQATTLWPEFTYPTAASDRASFWYMVPLTWIVLTMAIFFAGILDYPKFRFWVRLDRALLAGIVTALLPPVTFGSIVLFRYGEPIGSFLRDAPYEIGGLRHEITIAFHIGLAWLFCSMPRFMPLGPKLWPCGCLYRYALVAVLIFALYVIIHFLIVGNWR